VIEPQKYRKKPVVIEAMRFDAYTMALEPWSNAPHGGDLYRWMTSSGFSKFWLDQKDGPVFLMIHTLEEPMRADVGDWIIKGVAGEFYPCKNDIFQATYEAVDD